MGLGPPLNRVEEEMSDSATTLLNQMMGTCGMAIGILRTEIKYHLNWEQAQIAEIIVRTLESEIKQAKRIVEQAGVTDDALAPYRDHAIRAVRDVDWIIIPRSAKTMPADGGAFVEALIHVSDEDINLNKSKE